MSRLSNTGLASPVYFIVSGVKKNEGIVIEREPESVHASYRLSDDNWFLVQTNYDRNVPDPVRDQRRLPAENRLKSRGNKNFKRQDLFDVVMSKYPTLVKDTIMTVVMSSDEGYHNTTVWYGKNPFVPSLQPAEAEAEAEVNLSVE